MSLKAKRRLPIGIFPLIGGAIFLLCIWAFLEIAEDYPEGRYRKFDEAGLRVFRLPGNPEIPRGPLWLKEAMRDISALGSGAVLSSVVVAVAGYLVLLRRWQSAFSVTLASVGGAGLNFGLKALTGRPRPEIVPHLTEVTSSSFPSGHSMISAIIYLSMGAMMAQNCGKTAAAVYVVAFAAALTFAVGCTRIYLGVHYPSDVLAGWIAGTAWTLLCISTQRLLPQN